MLKTVGICILLFTLFCFVRQLGDGVRGRVQTLREIKDLILHVRREVGCYLLPLCDILSAYSTTNLEACGFLDMLRQGRDPMPVLTGKYRISDKAHRIVADLFSSFGEGYAEDVIRALDGAANEICTILTAEEAEAKKKVKLYSVLSCAGGLGALILFI